MNDIVAGILMFTFAGAVICGAVWCIAKGGGWCIDRVERYLARKAERARLGL